MAGFAARGGWWVAAQAALLTLFVAALLVGEPASPPAVVRGALRLGGLACLAAAAGLAVGGLRALGSGLTPYPEPRAGAALVDHGVYGLVRHPLYGAVVLGCAGAALVAGSVWAGLAAALLGAFFLTKAAHEERRLAAAYPGYAAYRRRVRRRLIPWLL